MENTAIHNIIDALKLATAIDCTFKHKGADKGFDGDLVIKYKGIITKAKVEYKKEVREINLPILFNLKEKKANLIIIADNIFPKIREELRRQEIGYLDGTGNVYIKNDNLLIWIETNRKGKNKIKIQNRAFAGTGLKVLFYFLQDETLVNTTHRELAKLADVAMGNINYIINGLKEAGYIIQKDEKNLKLINKKELLERWITEYGEKLKPKLLIGRYRFLKEEDHKNWQKLRLTNIKTQWGGEAAAEMLTKYLKADTLTLYTKEDFKEIIKNYRLLPDINGKVEVYKKFWNNDETNIDLVPPLLIYTDLINTGNARNIETAEKIYDDVLKNKYR